MSLFDISPSYVGNSAYTKVLSLGLTLSNWDGRDTHNWFRSSSQQIVVYGVKLTLWSFSRIIGTQITNDGDLGELGLCIGKSSA